MKFRYIKTIVAIIHIPVVWIHEAVEIYLNWLFRWLET